MTRELIAANEPIKVPTDVAACPYCETLLTVTPEQWVQRDDGTWACDGFHDQCETEPDIDTDEWEDWFSAHSVMPYVYHLPVQMKVMDWLNEHYDFNVAN